MRLYCAGPMRGIKDFNHPLFDEITEKLRSLGHEVFNPAEKDRKVFGEDILDHADTIDPRVCFFYDTEWICKYADGIVMLPGWKRSKGALAEWHLADALGLKHFYLETLYKDGFKELQR